MNLRVALLVTHYTNYSVLADDRSVLLGLCATIFRLVVMLIAAM